MQQAPVQQAPAPTPEELNQAMVEVSTRLNDNGAACHAIIQSIGVAGVAAMTDEQRTTVMAQVRAL